MIGRRSEDAGAVLEIGSRVVFYIDQATRQVSGRVTGGPRLPDPNGFQLWRVKPRGGRARWTSVYNITSAFRCPRLPR